MSDETSESTYQREGPLRLSVSRPSEQEEAEAIKTRIRAALVPVLAEMGEARRQGFIVQWQLALDQYGRDTIADLWLLKRFLMKPAEIGMLCALGGWVTGVTLTLLAVAALESGSLYDHDPAKLLELRRACLADSPNFETTFCDNYGELYSRIPKR